MNRTVKADGLLLLAAVIWGTGFVAQRKGMDFVGPMTFTGLRFVLGGLVLLPVLLHQHIRKPAGKSDKRFLILGSCIAGLMLFAGAALQQVGLVTTEAGKAGFITGLYVVIVAVIGIFLGHRVGWGVWLGSCLAIVGMYFLSVKESFTIEPGDVFVLCGAFFWAVHVQIIGYLAKRVNPLSLACVQFFACGIVSLCVALFSETISLEMIWQGGGAILYGGVMSVGIAFSLQVVSQRTSPPAHAAIIMSMEAVFATLAGWLMLNEMLDGRALMGCGLMLAGMLSVQLIPLLRQRKGNQITRN